MYTSLSNFGSLIAALNLRVGMLEADIHHQRHNPAHYHSQVKPTASEMLFGKGNELDATLPVFDENQDVFAHKLIDVDQVAPTVNSSVRLGSLVKFSTDDSYPTYGVVTPPPSFSTQKGVFVQSISATEASEIRKKNPHHEEISIGHESLKNVNDLRRSIKRQRQATQLLTFFMGDGTFNFLDGVSVIEFVIMFVICLVFFLSLGMLYMLFF